MPPRLDRGEALGFLRLSRVAHLATAGADGRPHAVPICFTLDGEVIYFSLDEKPKRVGPARLRRVRNILENPQVAVVADRYEDHDWSRLAYVLAEGRAELIETGDEHDRAIRLLREKYPQYRAMRLEERPIVKIAIERVVSWGAS